MVVRLYLNRQRARGRKKIGNRITIHAHAHTHIDKMYDVHKEEVDEIFQSYQQCVWVCGMHGMYDMAVSERICSGVYYAVYI